MNLRWTAKAGEGKAGKTVDMHRTQAMQMIVEGYAVALDPLDNIERQVIAERIEKRKQDQQIVVITVPASELEDEIDNDENY